MTPGRRHVAYALKPPKLKAELETSLACEKAAFDHTPRDAAIAANASFAPRLLCAAPAIDL